MPHSPFVDSSFWASCFYAVNVQWGREVLTDVLVDFSKPPKAFLEQIYTKTGVPIERQRYLFSQGALLKVVGLSHAYRLTHVLYVG
eukprot:243730-Prorocentrum_minimum.AAC.2